MSSSSSQNVALRTGHVETLTKLGQREDAFGLKTKIFKRTQKINSNHRVTDKQVSSEFYQMVFNIFLKLKYTVCTVIVQAVSMLNSKDNLM
jgi:hypothetical protein